MFRRSGGDRAGAGGRVCADGTGSGRQGRGNSEDHSTAARAGRAGDDRGRATLAAHAVPGGESGGGDDSVSVPGRVAALQLRVRRGEEGVESWGGVDFVDHQGGDRGRGGG